MNIDFSDTELLFLYGSLKQELSNIKSTKSIKISKSEIKLYESLLSKMESAYPPLKNLPL